MKTADLTGAALDWAVAKAEGHVRPDGGFYAGHQGRPLVRYSTDWSQGGPIIEREGLWVRESAVVSPAVSHLVTPDKKWFAYASHRYQGGDNGCYHGETFLIAAMRCYVASKLGDDVDVPPELLTAKEM